MVQIPKCAFCSAECRDYRIALDGFEKQLSFSGINEVDNGTKSRGDPIEAISRVVLIVILPNIVK